MNTNKKTLLLTQFSILLAIEALFCFTPLGSLPAIGPIVMTTAMIPVVVTGVLMGPAAGSLMGLFAGLFSFIVMSFMPANPITAFVFTPLYPPGNAWSLVICFVPRVLVGSISGAVFKALGRLKGRMDWLRYGLSGLLGSLGNTVGVMGGIWLFFGDKYVEALPAEYLAELSAQYPAFAGQIIVALILLTVVTSGIPEALLAAVAAYGVCKPLNKALKREK